MDRFEHARNAARLAEDYEIFDSMDELYDLMVAAGERQDTAAHDRYEGYLDIALAEAKRRGLITE